MSKQSRLCSRVFSTGMLSFLNCYSLEKDVLSKPADPRRKRWMIVENIPICGLSISKVACAAHSSCIEEFIGASGFDLYRL